MLRCGFFFLSAQVSGGDPDVHIVCQRLAQLRQSWAAALTPASILVQDQQSRLVAAGHSGKASTGETNPRLRILFAAPAWVPSRAFGGPVVAAGDLVRRLVARGNDVDVVTTTMVDFHTRLCYGP